MMSEKNTKQMDFRVAGLDCECEAAAIKRTAQATAREAGIDAVYGGLKPEGKCCGARTRPPLRACHGGGRRRERRADTGQNGSAQAA
jgi:hypothetical protein